MQQWYGYCRFLPDANCDYLKALFFNVLAAFWIQFMTHDWFSHTFEGRNAPQLQPVGCNSSEAKALGCREETAGSVPLPRHRGTRNVRAQRRKPPEAAAQDDCQPGIGLRDASQIYGHDALSQKRVQRDPDDQAKLLVRENYLPLLPNCAEYSADCPVQPQWIGQEATGFPANWNIGMSFYHNLFTREHNDFVDHFRERQRGKMPDADSGLRDPDDPERVIAYKDVSDERLYQVARLVVSAEIAKNPHH